MAFIRPYTIIRFSGPDWLPQYVRTYVERDVREIRNITDLMAFDRFVRLAAGRNGQELNLTALALDAGIDQKTAQAWLSILVSSFVVFLLRPYHRNYNKTITKRPKLYFWDTGLVCALLGMRTTAELAQHTMRGSLFESMVVADIAKHFMHQGLEPRTYYWRDKNGRELDLILETGSSVIPVEIKAGMTMQPAFFKNIKYWQTLTVTPKACIIYGGTLPQRRSDGTSVIPWHELVNGTEALTT